MKTKEAMDPELETSGDDFMVVWRDSDVRKSNLGKQAVLGARGLEEGAQCHANNLTFNQMDNPIYHQNFLGTSPNKRDGLFGSFGLDIFNGALGKRNTLDTGTTGNTGGLNLKSTIGQTAGCPTTKQMALVGVAADCTYIAEFPSEEEARLHIITQFNSA